jgi:putative hemolysin
VRELPSSILAANLSVGDRWMLVAIAALLVVTMLLAGAETGLSRMPKSRAQTLDAEGRRGARRLLELVSRPDQFVNPLLFALLICQLAQATLVGIVAERLWGLAGVAIAMALDIVVVFVVTASARTWAVLNPDRAALLAARPVAALTRFPLLRLTTRALIGLTNVLLPGKGLKQGPYVSEEELLAVAELGVEEGVIEEHERALIESIIEFGDTVVREVMVPRPDMVTVGQDFRVADVMEVVLLNGYSRLPVVGDSIDDVVGITYAKDLMRAERDGEEDLPVAQLVRAARYVPETKRVPEMLREMQRDKFHMAIVVDEYGGTAGLVTLEDIIEELVGEIVDEFDVEDPLVEPLAGGGVRVDARTALDEVNELLDAELPEGDWDTIGGLLYHHLGHVPVEGESAVVDGWQLTAQRIQGRRIGRVRITRQNGMEGAVTTRRARRPPSPRDTPPDATAVGERPAPAG